MYAVAGRDDVVWVEYKDSLTAFNAAEKGNFAGKGAINCQITTLCIGSLSLGCGNAFGEVLTITR